MLYTIIDNEIEIALFKNESDALNFLEWKREKKLQEINSDILDQIAKENNLDRKYSGSFPTSITESYYKNARKKISELIYLKENRQQ